MTEQNTVAVPPSGAALTAYYDTLLDSLVDGVLSISPDRRIEVLNATGAAILGCRADTVIGRSLAEAFLHDEANDDFLDAILAAVIHDGGTRKTVVDYSRGGETRKLAVASTAYLSTSGLSRGNQGVVVTFNDVTETLRLRAAEKSLEDTLADEHAKLRSAYVKLEDAAGRERRIAKQVSMIRVGAAVAVLLAVFGIGVSKWYSAAPAMQDDARAAPAAGSTMTVGTQPIVSRVAVVGSVDAGAVVSVVGPFDGSVQEKRFDYGGAVERGQVLVVVDKNPIEVQLRDAQGAFIKARQEFDTVTNWSTNAEVSRARRALAAAEQEKINLVNKVAQTKLLLDKGIIAADEYNQLVQQQVSQNAQLLAAKEDLATILQRGSDENRRVAEFEMQNAQVKLDGLRSNLENATVRAPVSGVVLQPVGGDGKQADMLAAGSRVNRGQTMFTIGDLESYSIRAKVDEVDVNKVHVGQPVEVTGDAFDGTTLRGSVVTVAAQAEVETQSRGGMASFPITVRISDMTPEQRARVHVGMSATVSIITYDNPVAVVIPPSALSSADDKTIVMVERDGHAIATPVTIGVSTPDGIEIRKGLKAGDVIQIAG